MAAHRDRVVISGMGVVSPVGGDLDRTWNSIKQGRSGVGPISSFDASRHKCRIAAEIKDFESAQIGRPGELRRMDRCTMLALAAAREALARADLTGHTTAAHRIGCVLGNCFGGIASYENDHAAYLANGPARTSPFVVLRLLPDMAASHIARVFGARGINYTISAACASGAHAIGAAMRHIQNGEADVMICGGTEAPITGTVLAGLCALGALSTRNDEPALAMRPFDRTRDGFVIGEGAAMLVLESLEHARRRSAPIEAELVGYGASNDVTELAGPDVDGSGFESAMRGALADAALSSSAIGYINANGTATELNDRVENAALARVFGTDRAAPLISSTKSMTGHLVGAAGALELAISVLALRHSYAPPTVGLKVLDSHFDLNYCAVRGVERKLTSAMSNSFGFGGHNASLIVSHFRD